MASTVSGRGVTTLHMEPYLIGKSGTFLESYLKENGQKTGLSYSISDLPHLMIPSLRGSAARATVFPTGYVCLACRGKPKSHLRATSTAAQQETSSSALSSALAAELTSASGKREAWLAYCRAAKRAKLALPKIIVKADDGLGYKAHLKLDGKVFTTATYKDKGGARGDAKMMVIDYIRNQGKAEPILVGLHAVEGAVEEAGNQKEKEASQELSQGSPRSRSKPWGGRQVKLRRVNSRQVDRKQLSWRPSAHQLRRLHPIRLPFRLRRIVVGPREPPWPSNVPPTSEYERQPATRAPEATLSTSNPTLDTSRQLKPARVIKDLRAVEGARTVHPLALQQENLNIPTEKVPRLSFGLDRVLFNPGVYHVQDPRSRVYNFDPYLEKITHPRNFNFAALEEFRPPSADDTLSRIAKEHKAKYFSSTSSITPVLVQLHFLLSNWRPLNFGDLSTKFFVGSVHDPDRTDFTKYQKSPQSIFLKPKQGGYAIDVAADKPLSGLLSFLGQCLEKLFTVPKEVFETYLKESGGEKPAPTSNGYHYTKFDSILVRSQLDAHDERLPGTGIFDIKTRAVLPIRMDTLEAQQDVSTNYELKTLHGQFESFEREFFDMARATMMKYSLQARLGRMDGIFVAYHNIVRLFGFQYLSIPDMDKVLHGQVDTTLGDAELNASLRVLSSILDHAIEIYPDEPVRLYFESRKAQKALNVYVVPVTEDQIDEQREEARRLSREYLKQLNETDANDKEPSITQANGNLAEGLLSEATDLESAEEVQNQLENILQDSNSKPRVAMRESDSNAASEDRTETEVIRDEVSRLFAMATKISMAMGVLERKEGDALDSHLIRKMMLKDITQRTFRFSRDVENLETLLESSNPEVNESYQVDLQRLSRLVKDQSELKQRLFGQAETENVMNGTEIRNLTNVQTLESALKASMERHTTPPPRLSAFSVKVQSHISNDLVQGPPEDITKDTQWELTYAFEDRTAAEVGPMYLRMIKTKDSAAMSNWESDQIGGFYEGSFFKHLMELSKEGGKWREERDLLDKSREAVVYAPRSE